MRQTIDLAKTRVVLRQHHKYLRHARMRAQHIDRVTNQRPPRKQLILLGNFSAHAAAAACGGNQRVDFRHAGSQRHETFSCPRF